MKGDFLIVDAHNGTTAKSLETLETALELIEKDYLRHKPIAIYELRDSRTDNQRIGFYLSSPHIQAIIGHSFWIPGQKTYAELTDQDGGTGTQGYKKAIALIYRFLNHQPRIVVDVNDDFFQNGHPGHRIDAQSIRERIESFKVIRVLEDPEKEVSQRALRELNYIPLEHNHSIIVLDTETERNFNDPKYQLGSTWDFYHGLRLWTGGQAEELCKECSQYDKVITYNGHEFDLTKVLRRHAPGLVDDLITKKSLDLYRIIRDAAAAENQLTRKGDLTLANVGFTTLRLCKWEIYHELDLQMRRRSIDEDIMDHCVRDVELARDLFFFMLEHRHIYYTSAHALENKSIINVLPTRKIKDAVESKKSLDY